MTTPSNLSTPANIATRLAPGGLALILLALACSLFGSLASAALLLLGFVVPGMTAVQDLSGLLARLALFVVLSGAFAAACWKIAPLLPSVPETEPETDHGTQGLRRALFAAGLCVAAFASLYHLADYPWAAPDETHHLSVVRNLAEYSAYASGHPNGDLNYFDPYDSVGAPVVLPGALAWAATGGGLAAPRAVIALHFLGLLGGLAWLLRKIPWAAALTPLVATSAYSSIYLSRTFYGEVPAMFYLVAGCCLWSGATGRWRYPGLLAAGVCFGLAVLCKPIFATLACCGLVALAIRWMLDRDARELLHVIVIGAGACVPLLARITFQYLHTPAGHDETRSLAGIYQHYLLFGVEPIGRNLMRLWEDHPAADAIALAVAAWWGGHLIKRREHPALIFLWMCGGFFTWWWLCFTPGQLTRYLWPGYVVAALGSAHLVPRLARPDLFPMSPALYRMRELLIVAILFYPGQWLFSQLDEVMNNREMRQYDAVIETIRKAPASATIGTTNYPIRGMLNVLTGRWIEGGDDPVGLYERCDYVVLGCEDDLLALSDYPHAVVNADPYWVVVKAKEP